MRRDVIRPPEYVHHVDLAGDVTQLPVDFFAEKICQLRIVNRNGNDLISGALRIVWNVVRGLRRIGFDAEHRNAMRILEKALDLFRPLEQMPAPIFRIHL